MLTRPPAGHPSPLLQVVGDNIPILTSEEKYNEVGWLERVGRVLPVLQKGGSGAC